MLAVSAGRQWVGEVLAAPLWAILQLSHFLAFALNPRWVSGRYAGCMMLRYAPVLPVPLPPFMMLGAALCYSVAVPSAVLLGGLESPFLWNACWRTGALLSGLLVLWSQRSRLGESGAVLFSLRDWRVPVALLAFLNFSLIIWSARLAAPSIAAVIHHVWPVFFVFCMVRAMPGRYRRPGWRVLLPMLGGLAGVALVVQSGEGILVVPSLRFLLGSLLAFCSVLFVMAGAAGYSWAADLARGSRDSDRSLLAGLMLIFVLGTGFSAALNLLLGLVSREVFPWGGLWVFLLGFLLDPLGTVLNRLAHVLTRTLALEAVAYAEPLLVILWLSLLMGLQVERVDVLLAGAALVVLSNLAVLLRSSRAG